MTGDYVAAVAAFSPERPEAGLHGTLRSLNACTERCDHHPAGALALRWSNAAGGADTLTFGELRDRAARFANLLAANGVQPGDVVPGTPGAGERDGIACCRIAAPAAMARPMRMAAGVRALSGLVPCPASPGTRGTAPRGRPG